jgi:hypothetical protein
MHVMCILITLAPTRALKKPQGHILLEIQTLGFLMT